MSENHLNQMPTYYTHDNGDRPFKVVTKEKKVTVYTFWDVEERKAESVTSKQEKKWLKEWLKKAKPREIVYNAEKLFIGNDSDLGKEGKGNSILLKDES